MKLINVLFVLLFLVPLTFVSCSKDDDKDAKTNSFTYDGTSHELGGGALEYYGQLGVDEGYNFDLTLFNPGITVNSETGTVYGFYFEMFSAVSTDLQAGTYTFDADDTYAAGTFDAGAVFVGWNIATDEGSAYNVTAGTVVIAKSGTNYEVTINITVYGGKTVTGYYKGTLEKIDFKKGTLEKRFKK